MAECDKGRSRACRVTVMAAEVRKDARAGSQPDPWLVFHPFRLLLRRLRTCRSVGSVWTARR